MYVLTDGDSFLAYTYLSNPHGFSPWKTKESTKAYFFDSEQDALQEKKRMPRITRGLDVVSMARERQKRKKFCNSVREEVFNKTNGHCWLCGCNLSFDEFTIDHKIPLSSYGTNDTDNLYPSCHACNEMKADLTLNDFISKMEEIIHYQKENVIV